MVLAAASIVSILLSASGTAAPLTSRPRLAPRQYTTFEHGLTFQVPKSATYCPLPTDWVGSDHGTTVFLERPRRCGGAGYPSSARSFEPEYLARIDLFYGYSTREDEAMDEDKSSARPCRRVGMVLFLGARREVCEERKGGFVIRSVKAYYPADGESEAVLTLITRPERVRRDMPTFEAAAASFRTCKSIWKGPKRPFTIGYGVRCPRGSKWF